MEKDCNDIRYTQFLYRLKDCISAFVITLVKRDDIEIVLFWASEIISVVIRANLLNCYPVTLTSLSLIVLPWKKPSIKNCSFNKPKTLNIYSLLLSVVHESKKDDLICFIAITSNGKTPKINIKQGEPFLKNLFPKLIALSK